MSEIGARGRFRQQSLTLAAMLLCVLLFAALVAIFGAGQFDRFQFFRFPLGFYLAGQALPIAIAAVGFWFARMQDRLDLELSEAAEF
jgi:putative solute:sodium symporter small subunit